MPWRMKGQYLKNCNCTPTCACDTVGVPVPGPACEGMAAMHIDEGNFDDVRLDGLNWAVTYHWPGPLHEGNGTAQPFIDVRATEEQRGALLKILSAQAGNPWFEVLVSVVSTFHEPQFAPIQFSFDKEKRQASVSVAGFFETESEPLRVPYGDDRPRVVLRLPGGMEYKEMEVAQTSVLRGTGPIKFDHKGTHSSLADVEHTDQGLVA